MTQYLLMEKRSQRFQKFLNVLRNFENTRCQKSSISVFKTLKNFIFLRRFTRYRYEFQDFLYLYRKIMAYTYIYNAFKDFNGFHLQRFNTVGAEFSEVYVSIVARSYRYSESLRFPMILLGSQGPQVLRGLWQIEDPCGISVIQSLQSLKGS